MSRKNVKVKQKKTPWDEAIEDAQAQLVEAMRRVSQLKEAIAGFVRSRERGDPWPGSATQN